MMALSSCTLVGTSPVASSPQPSAPSSPTPRIVSPSDYVVENCGVSTAKTGNVSNVLLTIDDFPSERSKASGDKMIQIADWARENDVMMEAFPIKSKVDAYQKTYHKDLMAELRARGTYVSNHSFSHLQLTKLSKTRLTEEISGGVASTYLRPPYGDYNAGVKEVAEAAGYRLCTWTLDTNDWRLVDGVHPSAEELIHRVKVGLAKTPKGAPVVILGHYFTNYPRALQGILEVARANNRICPAPRTPTTETVPFPIC